MLNVVIAAFIALTVAGCQTRAEREAISERGCASYGLNREAAAYRNCLARKKLEQQGVSQEYERQAQTDREDVSNFLQRRQ